MVNGEELIRAACEAQKNSYAPYSGFVVGAALLAEGGTVYTGCNIENAAFSPTNCAERTAFFKAVSEGEHHFSAIAITGNRKGEQPEEGAFCMPCGVCRQVMAEFCNPECFTIYVTDGRTVKSFLLKELLPGSFGAANLSEK